MHTAGKQRPTPLYQISGLQVILGGKRILGPLDLDIAEGAFLGVLGPNGSGKTSLLRTMTGGLRPSAGGLLLQGRALGAYRPLELARIVGVVPQQFSLDFNFTVGEMVAMGCYAREGRGSAEAADGEAVAAALDFTHMSALSGRLVTELSGGERQRALIAQTLAQRTPVLLLDEPLNNLDLNHQLELMQLLGRLHAEGRTIVVVLHDLNMAAQYCEELVLLDQGRLAARGTPHEILDPRTILEVFKVRVAVHRQSQRPYLTPLWSRSAEPVPAGPGRVHVIAGGGAASGVIDELVLRGFVPTVGIVSVFDTDFATAQRYELEVVSAPPFEAFPADAVADMDSLADKADVLIVSAVFFGKGNLAPLRTAVRLARAGKRVIAIDVPPIGERDMSGGEATRLFGELLAAGAVAAADAADAVDRIGAPS